MLLEIQAGDHVARIRVTVQRERSAQTLSETCGPLASLRPGFAQLWGRPAVSQTRSVGEKDQKIFS